MNQETHQVIEINGVKMEVDMRHARRVDHFRIGDACKLLLTGSNYSNPEVVAGVIVDFESFKSLPTIVVAYVKSGYGSTGLDFAYVNEKSADKYELVASSSDSQLAVNKAEVLQVFEREEAKLQAQIDEVRSKRRYFMERFGAYFSSSEKELA